MDRTLPSLPLSLCLTLNKTVSSLALGACPVALSISSHSCFFRTPFDCFSSSSRCGRYCRGETLGWVGP